MDAAAERPEAGGSVSSAAVETTVEITVPAEAASQGAPAAASSGDTKPHAKPGLSLRMAARTVQQTQKIYRVGQLGDKIAMLRNKLEKSSASNQHAALQAKAESSASASAAAKDEKDRNTLLEKENAALKAKAAESSASASAAAKDEKDRNTLLEKENAALKASSTSPPPPAPPRPASPVLEVKPVNTHMEILLPEGTSSQDKADFEKYLKETGVEKHLVSVLATLFRERPEEPLEKLLEATETVVVGESSSRGPSRRKSGTKRTAGQKKRESDDPSAVFDNRSALLMQRKMLTLEAQFGAMSMKMNKLSSETRSSTACSSEDELGRGAAHLLPAIVDGSMESLTSFDEFVQMWSHVPFDASAMTLEDANAIATEMGGQLAADRSKIILDLDTAGLSHLRSLYNETQTETEGSFIGTEGTPTSGTHSMSHADNDNELDEFRHLESALSAASPDPPSQSLSVCWPKHEASPVPRPASLRRPYSNSGSTSSTDFEDY